jgi:hypothetical protein
MIEYLRKNQICIYYYCKPIYHEELNYYLKQYGYEKEIYIQNLNKITEEEKHRSLEVWIGLKTYMKSFDKTNSYEYRLKEMFSTIKEMYGMKDIDTTYGFDILYKERNIKKKQYDILICNSIPLSKQMNKKEIEEIDILWIHMYLNERRKPEGERKRIITTRKMPEKVVLWNKEKKEKIEIMLDIPYTQTEYPRLYDIGELSSKCEYILGVNSGPIVACMRKDTIERVKSWILYDKNEYRYENKRIEMYGEMETYVNRIKKEFDF